MELAHILDFSYWWISNVVGLLPKGLPRLVIDIKSCFSFSLQNIILHGEMHFYPLTKYENRASIDKYYLPFVYFIKDFLRKTVTFSAT